MNIVKSKIWLGVILFIFLSFNRGFAQEDKKIYLRAVQTARSGDREFAFMDFRSLLQDFPDSKYAPEALFATGEYYFLVGNPRGAIDAFTKSIATYPDSSAKPFALAYLLMIARRQGNGPLTKKLEKEIVTFQQISLMFRDFKEYKYQSALYRKHKVVYYINQVEFYVDGQFFTKISY